MKMAPSHFNSNTSFRVTPPCRLSRLRSSTTPNQTLLGLYISKIPSEITEPRCGGTSSRAEGSETDTVESQITRAHWRDAQIHVTSKEISRANAMGSHWLTRRVAPLPNLAPKSRTTSQCSPDKTRPPSVGGPPPLSK